MEPRGVNGEELMMSDPLADSVDEPGSSWIALVFEDHHLDVWRFVARIAGRDTADDVTGEVFAAAWEQRTMFDPARGSARGWLYGIALNRLRTRFRSDERARRAFARSAWQREIAADAIELVDDQLTLQTTSRIVIDALERLSASERELLVLYAWEQLSYSEIAVVVGIPVGTVRSRLARSRARLRDLIALLSTEPLPTTTDRGSQ